MSRTDPKLAFEPAHSGGPHKTASPRAAGSRELRCASRLPLLPSPSSILVAAWLGALVAASAGGEEPGTSQWGRHAGFYDGLNEVGIGAEEARRLLDGYDARREPVPYLPEFVMPPAFFEDGQGTVLHVGCGRAQVHPYFAGPRWKEVRVDINAANLPDIVADMTTVSEFVPAESIDAVFSAHSLEHLHPRQGARCLEGFFKVLRPGGFLLATVPDAQAALSLLKELGPDEPVHHLEGGEPVTVIDLLYGHQSSVAAGNVWMRHKTGFTEASLATAAVEAGFREVQTFREFSKHTRYVDVWILARKGDGNEPKASAERSVFGLGTVWNMMVAGIPADFNQCFAQCAGKISQPTRKGLVGCSGDCMRPPASNSDS